MIPVVLMVISSLYDRRLNLFSFPGFRGFQEILISICLDTSSKNRSNLRLLNICVIWKTTPLTMHVAPFTDWQRIALPIRVSAGPHDMRSSYDRVSIGSYSNKHANASVFSLTHCVCLTSGHNGASFEGRVEQKNLSEMTKISS
jgi:hypothetical protein